MKTTIPCKKATRFKLAKLKLVCKAKDYDEVLNMLIRSYRVHKRLLRKYPLDYYEP